jgi:hypothetical protein
MGLGRKHVEAVSLALRPYGWTEIARADTLSREKGPDLVLGKETRKLVVEAKGYPDTIYARGPNQGKPKPTKPRLQAKHWFAEALLSAMLLQTEYSENEIGIALPNNERYLQLYSKVRQQLDRIGLHVFFVDAKGKVQEGQGRITVAIIPQAGAT